MPTRLIILNLAIVLLIACTKTDQAVRERVERAGEPDVLMVNGDDQAMNAAIAKARETVSEFQKHLGNPTPQQSDFSIKARFAEDGKIEHMWLTEVTFDGTSFHGKVGNEPFEVKNVALGDEVSVKPAEISDWMFVDSNKLVGGYTIRALRDRLSDEEKVEFDTDLPFRIE